MIHKDTAPPVVLLVDNRKRDLDAAALIAHQLRSLDVECFLEPLEAFRAVLAAYRPGMIVFNHLFASHLAAWSQRLADIGVLTGVLSNEGMYLKPDVLRFNTGQFHRDAHVDYFFCWNGVYRDALRENAICEQARVEVVGIPRFDFYFSPWARVVQQRPLAASARPRILACTNFPLAKFHDLPREHGDRFFAAWASRLPRYADYWGAIESHWKSQRRFLDYLAPLLATRDYDIVLRPHPGEKVSLYESWLTALSPSERERVRIDAHSDISSLILDCDLEISGESCTTAVECWIAGKPTIELVFDRHPMLYSEERSQGNVHCDDPAKLVGLVEQQLVNSAQQELQQIRRQYLERWCATPDGNACRRVAEIAAAAVKSKRPADWSKLTANDYRRAAKLKAVQFLGQAYHFDPLLALKSRLFGDRYAIKQYTYAKSIRPRDVAAARSRMEAVGG